MALTNICGFEVGTDDLISLNGTSSIQTSTKRTGEYALRVNPAALASGDAKIGTLMAATGLYPTASGTGLLDCYVRFYFRYATKPTTTASVMAGLAQRDQGATALCFRLNLNTAGTISAVNAVGTVMATGSTALSQDTWYRIEFYVQYGDSDAWEVQINGTTEISGTGADLAAGTEDNAIALGRVVLGRPDIGIDAVDFFYDDLAVSDSAFIGAGQSVRLDANADGTYTAFTAGAGAGDYTALDEYASQSGNDGDTSYSTHSTNNGKESVNLVSTSTAGISGTINGVKAIVVARDEAQTLSFNIGIRSNSTDRFTTATDGGATYAGRGKFEAVNAGNGNAAWTTGDIDGAEVIIQHQQAQSRALRVTAMAMMVDFTPAGAISGTAAMAFSQNSTATGAGALSGTSAVALSNGTTTLTGAGVLSGTAAGTFASSAALDGLVLGSATEALTFGQSGAITGAGALTGTIAATFGNTATLTGSGVLTGTCAAVFSQNSTLTGAGALAATSAVTFASNSTLTGAGALAGTSTITFDVSGTLVNDAGGAISGSSAMTFGENATLTASGILAGSFAVVFGESTTLTGAGDLAGSVSATFGNSATLTGDGALSGTITAVFGESGTVTGAGSLAGSLPVTFGFIAGLSGSGDLAGTTTITFAPSGTFAEGDITGSISFTFTLSGTLSSTMEPPEPPPEDIRLPVLNRDNLYVGTLPLGSDNLLPQSEELRKDSLYAGSLPLVQDNMVKV